MPTLHGTFDLFAPESDEPCELCGYPGALATYRPFNEAARSDEPGRAVRLHAFCAAVFIDRYGRSGWIADGSSDEPPRRLADPQS